jgi:hypothetical protein
VVQRDGNGDLTIAPVTSALLLHRPQMKFALTKMLKVQELGFVTARRDLRVGRHRKAIVRADGERPFLWELKCTPAAWRLYFYTWENDSKPDDKRLIYVHAIYKKKTAQDDAAAKTARRALSSICPGGAQIRLLEFPAGHRI